MKKTGIVILALLMLTLVPVAFGVKTEVNTIPAGEVFYSATHYLTGPIPTGFDEYGYNYQGHMFRGSYHNSYAGGYGLPVWEGDDESYYQRLVDEGYFIDVTTAEATATGGAGIWWAFPYRDVHLDMKWNDAWISNKDYDLDGYLDRHPGYPDYPNSGAWLTNHQSGEYEQDGEIIKWNYFVKIVTPSPINGDYVDTGIWYNTNNEEIGAVIWGAFAIVHQVENDAGIDAHGIAYSSVVSDGFGYYKAY